MRFGPIHDAEIERGVLGGALMTGALAVERLTVDARLRASDFHLRAHQLIFAAMVELYDAGSAIDTVTVTDRLRITGQLDAAGGGAFVDALNAYAPAAGNWRDYGERVRRDALRRERRAALYEADTAIESGDEAAYARAEARLIAADGEQTKTTWDRDTAREHVFEYLAGKESDVVLTPFAAVNRLLYGGLRLGSTSLLCGWTSAGKSTICDGLLDHAAGQGVSAHLYLNEMSLLSRSLRTLAAMSGVPFGRLLERDLNERDHRRVMQALELGYPWGMTNCAGWPAQDICRHILARRWGMAGLDGVHGIPHTGREEIDAISSQLAAAAQEANTALVAVGQLNRARADSGVLPLPVERDVRESGKLVYDCDNLLFVHRDQEEVTVPFARGSVATGEIRRLSTALLVVAKARNGELGKCPISLDTQRMRYDAELEIPEAAA